MAFRPDPKKPKPKPKGGKGYAPLLVLLALLIALIVTTNSVSAIYNPPAFDPFKPPRLGKPFAKARVIPAGLDPNHVECWFYVGKGKGWVAQVCYAK